MITSASVVSDTSAGAGQSTPSYTRLLSSLWAARLPVPTMQSMHRAPAVDPEFLETLSRGPARLLGVTSADLPGLRDGLVRASRSARPSPNVERFDVEVPGCRNEPSVLLRVHRPTNLEGAVPCLFAIHGGGFILGTYEVEDQRSMRGARSWASSACPWIIASPPSPLTQRLSATVSPPFDGSPKMRHRSGCSGKASACSGRAPAQGSLWPWACTCAIPVLPSRPRSSCSVIR